MHDIQAQLRELSFELMKIEMSKMMNRNDYAMCERLGFNTNRTAFDPDWTTLKAHNQSLKVKDTEGYEKSLTFNELLLGSTENFDALELPIDATYIATEYLLNQHGLVYPSYQADDIDANLAAYLTQVSALEQAGTIDAFTCERLTDAGKYFAAYQQLLYKYSNQEKKLNDPLSKSEIVEEPEKLDLKDQLRALSTTLMEIEMSKMQSANYYALSQRIEVKEPSDKWTTEYLNQMLNGLDAEGYEKSLAFNELLLSANEPMSSYDKERTFRKYNPFENGPDATYIAAEYLLNQHGLNYPISWRVIAETRDGLVFGYDKSDIINKKHAIYLQQIEAMAKANIIDSAMFERLVAAGEYFAAHRRQLSKYHNKEDNLDVGAGPSQ